MLRHGSLAIALEGGEDDALLVRLHGDVDPSTVDHLRSVLDASIATGARAILVDLQSCTLFGACAMGALVEARRHLDDGSSLRVVQPSCTAACVLRAVGLGDLLTANTASLS